MLNMHVTSFFKVGGGGQNRQKVLDKQKKKGQVRKL